MRRARSGRDVPTVQGNHDRAVASGRAPGFNGMAQAGVDYARDHLGADALDWLDGLPTERHVVDDRVTVVHGHPDDPDHYTYPREFAPDLLDGAELLVMGHTHVQHHAVFGDGIVLNPGSVGQPRDRDPDAAYAVVDLDERTVDERRVSYDIDAVVDAVAEAGLPAEIGERLRDGR
ncbi:phosphodiesterase [Halolamina pelagica]|uniref:Phosphodiesterase n=1 Tax=Halolamina pelagica TaxID=699431 RepID=A0A0P7GA60_9EURY|nr:phosphodiesterase [Halolamina pelagica]